MRWICLGIKVWDSKETSPERKYITSMSTWNLEPGMILYQTVF